MVRVIPHAREAQVLAPMHVPVHVRPARFRHRPCLVAALAHQRHGMAAAAARLRIRRAVKHAA